MTQENSILKRNRIPPQKTPKNPKKTQKTPKKHKKQIFLAYLYPIS